MYQAIEPTVLRISEPDSATAVHDKIVYAVEVESEVIVQQDFRLIGIRIQGRNAWYLFDPTDASVST